jgi:hypothetical protein
MEDMHTNYSITENITEECALEQSSSIIICTATDTTVEVPQIVTHSQHAVIKVNHTSFAAIIVFL